MVSCGLVLLCLAAALVASFVQSFRSTVSFTLLKQSRLQAVPNKGAARARKKRVDKLAPAVLEKKRVPRKVDCGPKRWRVSNVHIPLDLDIGKDDTTVREALLDSLATTLDLTTKKLATCDIVVAKKSYDGRRRKSSPPGFTYIVDITEGLTFPLKLREKPGRVERIRDDKGGGADVAKGLADFAALLSPKEGLLASPLATNSKIVVVGAGPAGLFAALALVKAGHKPVIIERGQPVETRSRSIGELLNRRILDPESNLCFGEGGAGTWSDGKLTTGTGKNSAEVRWVMQQLVQHGAPERILVDGKPHLGTDRLVTILKGLREYLTSKGVNFMFQSRVDELVIEGSGGEASTQSAYCDPLRRVVGVRISDSSIKDASSAPNSKDVASKIKSLVPADYVVLAVGHSARNLYRSLHHDYGVQLTAKPIAAGFRVEHPQELINRIQYGAETAQQCDRGKGKVPVADYRVATEVFQVNEVANSVEKRQCYSFCVCPGGIIVPTSVNAEELCINGMSYSRRQSQWANSALVVNVNPEDTGFSPSATGRDCAYGTSSDKIVLDAATPSRSPLQGIYWQEEMERRAAKMGGGKFVVPVQRVTDFLAGTVPVPLAEDATTNTTEQASLLQPISSSYRLGVKEAPLHELFPPFITDTLRKALVDFNRTVPGYITPDAILHGVETRTSSPVQITRHRDSCESVSLAGLFPAGEGAGYAGGIISAAVDGLRVAQAILHKITSLAPPKK